MPASSAPQILIVEDEESFRRMLSTVLEQQGYAVVTAADGGEALRYLRSETPPEIILLDLAMPGIDGAAFRSEQRWDPDRGQIPVVVLSAVVPDQELLTTLAPAAYLTKPFELRKLLEVVKAICRPRGSGRT